LNGGSRLGNRRRSDADRADLVHTASVETGMASIAHSSESSHEGDGDLHNHFEVTTVVKESGKMKNLGW
jgi:hypothetical protein